ncbi:MULTISPECIES: PLP-dependent cysteine synthase family protein [Sphingobacterium]|uniref:PLP-dependent cysteine synthase family protein n=1 Tax=Sphingobacterium populi TaxID=1812824 RepID=A0ABW5UGY2_9SPHI|nr:cysteine synthase family protein [Sphingobacterium sp. CFCC 11742]
MNNIVPIPLSIGNTPIRKCDFLSEYFKTNIFVKDEFHNPGMSSKDRPAYFMIQDAIQRNRIQAGGTFVEASSGNTGLGIALIARQLGYKVKIFVSKSCSQEKIDKLEEAGASIELCDNSNGLQDFQSTQFRAQSFAAKEQNAYFTNQYYNTQNIRAHYRTTGPEIWEQTDGQITHFLCGIGTGGTISGVGRFLKEQAKAIRIWGVEPRGSILQHYLKHRTAPNAVRPFDAIEGIGRNFVPGSFDPQPIDQIFQVEKDVSIDMAQWYYQHTDIRCGFSSAAVLASLKCYSAAMRFHSDDNVLLFFPDHGSRYLSKLYAENSKVSTSNAHSLNG